jgi:crotonobetainyl-CoA:carnitine CoA-transferase CaiB-like acyl-CoA transferase
MTLWFGVDVNQGKRSIILDLKTEKGRAVLARLVRKADVIIHNYLDRSLPGIGISPEQLREINPNVISSQISAWAGSEGGPLKDFPAYDPVLQAATGITARYGEGSAGNPRYGVLCRLYHGLLRGARRLARSSVKGAGP